MNILKKLAYGSTVASAIVVLIPFASAQERSSPPAIVVRSCSGCHGLTGKSQLPYIPRLGGQSAEYLEGKLRAFRDAVPSPVNEAFHQIAHLGSAGKDAKFTAIATAQMVGVESAMSDKDVDAAAQWYAGQEPARGKSGKGKILEEGRSLYINGLQSQHVPACQTCHGPEAQGTNTAPRLAGQNASYVLGQLALFRGSERHKSPMREIARSLESEQARSVAVYLQSR